MVERRKKMYQTLMQTLGEHDHHFLKTMIPYSVTVENMGLHREPIGVYAPRSLSARAYQNLWNEIEQQLLLSTLSWETQASQRHPLHSHRDCLKSRRWHPFCKLHSQAIRWMVQCH